MAVAIDVGSYNLVVAKRNEKNEIVFKKEINGFIEIPIENKFVFNMMKNSGVPLVENPKTKSAFAVGSKAVDIAVSMGLELKRPMKEGCLNPNERNAQQILSITLHSLIGDLKQDKEPLFYCIPSNAINIETDKDYHSLILKAMFDAYADDKGNTVVASPINEALAIIYAECQKTNYTGIGVSFGSGMTNVCYAIYGNPAFEFAIAQCGDWVDHQVAKVTNETPIFINQEKMKVDFTKDSDSLVHRAIKAQYEILITKTVAEIKKGMDKVGNKGKNAGGKVNIVIAGGTSSPPGFKAMFEKAIRSVTLPLEIGEIIQPIDPLYTVAKGILIACEANQ